ncbi:MAG: hypothetical protein J0M34_07735 [Alphaproteobacteria bacterium]|nr:hypothetical protein [Alphaproteobacteria bacterium]
MLEIANHHDDEMLFQAFEEARSLLLEEHKAMKLEMKEMARAGKTKDPDYLTDAELNEGWNYTETLLDHLKQGLAEAKTREQQENLIRIALENGFNSTVIAGQPILGYEAFVEFISLFKEEIGQHYDPEENPWTDFLEDMIEYGDFQHDAYYDVCDLVAARRIAKGEDSAKVYSESPYRLACKAYSEKHPEFDSDEFTSEQFDQVSEAAQDLVEDALTPFEACLPEHSPMSIAWFIGRATDLHESHSRTPVQRLAAAGQRSYGFTRQMPAITPANDGGERLPGLKLQRLRMFPKRIESPTDIANDNSVGEGVEIYNNQRIQNRVVDTLTPIFLNHIDAATNVHDLLAAKRQLQSKLQVMETGSEIAQR